MIGRIRTINPELLDDERTAALPDRAFRLFIGLILMADDHGNLRATPALIKGAVFWAVLATIDEVEVALDELGEAGLVARYEVRGQPYCALLGWTKHQRVDHPSKPRVPSIDDPESVPLHTVKPKPRETLARARESLAPDLRPPTSDLRPPTSDLRPPTAEAAPTGASMSTPSIPEPERRRRRSGKDAALADHRQEAVRLWDRQEALRREINPACRARAADDARIAPIASLLASGRSPADCEAVLGNYAAESKRTNDLRWFDGVTNWRPANFERALGHALGGNGQPLARARPAGTPPGPDPYDDIIATRRGGTT